VLLAAPLAGGCETSGIFAGNPENQTPGAGEWQATEPLEASSLEVVWDHVRTVALAEGYAQDDTRTQYDRREFVSRWITFLSSLRYEGQRRRLHVVIDEAGPGKWVVRACVIRQRNADIDQPDNPAKAEWEDAGVEPSRTGLVLWKIRAGFARDEIEGGEDTGPK